ncbi:MAG TPA: hypothetical protein DCY35_00925 [Prolixibacteraceae bacterium]|nr:hypothetical protein [Prolixibacteraceae bacterium]
MDENNSTNRVIDATELLLDSDMEKILLGTYQRSRTAVELSEIYGMPIAICFRKIKVLKNRNLLKTNETSALWGKKTERYTANLEDAYVFYDSGRVKVRFTVVLQMADDFRRRYERAASAYRNAEMVSAEANQI